MTIDEAIKELTKQTEHNCNPYYLPLHNALKLGIEALKAWKEFRGSGSLMDKMLLPGETEE